MANFCSRCGCPLDPNASFCSNCGIPIKNDQTFNAPNTPYVNNNFDPNNGANPCPPQDPMGAPFNGANPYAPQEPMGNAFSGYNNNFGAPSVQNQPQPQPPAKPVDNSPKAALILGILGIVFAWLFAFVGHVLSIIGIIIGAVELKKTRKPAGLIVSIVGETCAIASSIIGIILSVAEAYSSIASDFYF